MVTSNKFRESLGFTEGDGLYLKNVARGYREFIETNKEEVKKLIKFLFEHLKKNFHSENGESTKYYEIFSWKRLDDLYEADFSNWVKIAKEKSNQKIIDKKLIGDTWQIFYGHFTPSKLEKYIVYLMYSLERKNKLKLTHIVRMKIFLTQTTNTDPAKILEYTSYTSDGSIRPEYNYVQTVINRIKDYKDNVIDRKLKSWYKKENVRLYHRKVPKSLCRQLWM